MMEEFKPVVVEESEFENGVNPKIRALLRLSGLSGLLMQGTKPRVLQKKPFVKVEGNRLRLK